MSIFVEKLPEIVNYMKSVTILEALYLKIKINLTANTKVYSTGFLVGGVYMLQYSSCFLCPAVLLRVKSANS